ncbi:hypothetical protein GCM10011392_31370 [Wenxinia marina]|nr:HAMP domain-containing sensor histidine kinase [Wenxinia marina]GGL74473.1 hypothetical protein GCM10011392_31370 [Wenxinia marina]
MAEARRLADGISRAAARLDRVVTGTLDYVRAGREEGSALTDLGGIIRDIAAACLPSGARLTVEGELPAVPARPVEMDIVLRNLIDNAVKHHPHRTPTISVTYRPGAGGRAHVVEVADDGPGIPPERRDTLFRPGGTVAGEERGMGLAMVRRLVDGWGGTVDVADAPGGGALFRVAWPG